MFSGSGNTGNQILDNEVTSNHWGILVNNFAGNSGNLIRSNRLRGNGRAGIATLLAATGNTIQDNDAQGNGLLNIAPSLLFDLFDQGSLDNTWQNNQGRFNGTTASATSASSQAATAEAFSDGGCLSPRRQH